MKEGATRLRLAGLSDTSALAELYRQRCNESGAIEQWLEQGGVLLLEAANGKLLGALRWRYGDGGWWLEQPLTPADSSQDDIKRWLLTKVEALAIVHNIPALYLEPPEDAEDARTYARLGYLPITGGRLGKQVGGTWQVKR